MKPPKRPKREIVLRFFAPGGREVTAEEFEAELRKAGRTGK